jgi:hypothetical protein
MIKCEGIIVQVTKETSIVSFSPLPFSSSKQTPCPNKATKIRHDYRFGKPGEPVFVKTTIHLCSRCCETWDEIKAEAAAEGRLS